MVLNGVESDWADVLGMSSSGLHSWPLAFLIYINDIVNNICSSTRLFADGTSIYIVTDDPKLQLLFLILTSKHSISKPMIGL